jgi:hypothetical protein
MTTIIRHDESGVEYVLVGTGLGMFQATKPHWFLGDWGSETKSGVSSCVCAADGDGTLRWMPSKHVTVVSVDGVKPTDILAG